VTVQPSTANPAGQPVLHRRVSTHATAVARMRACVGPTTDPADPSHAVLDAWAVVCDVVAFYSERIATEAFLRTATRLDSVRELARTLGHELRPGVCAQADLVFLAEDAAGAPEAGDVPLGTPVQSVPGAGELPQTFETAEDLQIRPAWNALAVLDARPQALGYDRGHVWLRGATDVKVGDPLLVVGAERVGYAGPDADEHWDFRVAAAVDNSSRGWTKVAFDRPLGFTKDRPLVAEKDVTVHALTVSTRLFGASAPDPNLLADDDGPPPGASAVPATRSTQYVWDGYAVPDAADPTVIEVDGSPAGLREGTWLVLEQPGSTEAYLVQQVGPDGGAKFGITGPLTRTRLDIADGLAGFDRHRARVHCASRALPAAEEPDDTAVTGRVLHVAACDPLLPAGRRVVVRGLDADTGLDRAETHTVAACEADGGAVAITLADDLTGRYAREGLVVHANAVRATHGQTVEQVLGSGDGRTGFLTLRLRRDPLTHVRTTTPAGAAPALTVRVDGVAWEPVTALSDAGPHDRVYTIARHADGTRITFGDGVHGARPATGAENITATYRVGIGADGDLGSDRLTLLTRRPLGVRSVTNPATTTDSAPPETLAQARVNAGLRVRTLDRVVSATDYADFARGYAGVGPARADVVWDGRVQRVVLSVLGADARLPSDDLLDDLHTAIDDARDPRARVDLRIGAQTWFAVRVELAHDLAYERDVVEDSVLASLEQAFGARDFAAPVTAAAVLVVVKAVPGVRACTIPRLLPVAAVPAPPLVAQVPDDSEAVDPVPALPGRWDDAVLPAQLLALAPGAVEIGEMAP